MTVYDEDSALILVMNTDVLGIRPFISGTCLLILPSFAPGCFRDWYMFAHPALLCSLLYPACPSECAHLLRPKGTLGQGQTILFSQLLLTAQLLLIIGCRGRGRGGWRPWRVGGVGFGVGVSIGVSVDDGVATSSTAANDVGGGVGVGVGVNSIAAGVTSTVPLPPASPSPSMAALAETLLSLRLNVTDDREIPQAPSIMRMFSQ
jgi:hypothetical protein